MSDSETYIPVAGNALKVEDFELIIEAITRRQQKFRQESLRLSIGVVLANVGDRFAPAQCIKGEWSGIKADLEPTTDIPKCPNGHVLMQGEGLKLGWVAPVVLAVETLAPYPPENTL